MFEPRGFDGFKNLKHPFENVMNEDPARMLKMGYYASVSYVDEQFGKLVAHVKELDIYDNTIIIVWGDHDRKLGEHNGWCKQTNYNFDIQVPMMVYNPKVKSKNQQTFELTELIDIFPSLCDLAGIDKPDYLQGTSFVPLLDNPKHKWKTAVFSQFHRRPKVTPDGGRYMGYSIRTKDYHFVAWYNWDHVKGLKGEFVTSELYDIKKDPDENLNVVSDPAYLAVADGLAAQLEAGWKAARPME